MPLCTGANATPTLPSWYHALQMHVCSTRARATAWCVVLLMVALMAVHATTTTHATRNECILASNVCIAHAMRMERCATVHATENNLHSATLCRCMFVACPHELRQGGAHALRFAHGCPYAWPYMQPRLGMPRATSAYLHPMRASYMVCVVGCSCSCTRTWVARRATCE